MRKYRRGIRLAIKGAGFISNKLLNSNMTLDFAYTLYLILASTPEIPKDQIKRFVQKWFVLSTLTSRYTASPESQMHRDMQSIEEKGISQFLRRNRSLCAFREFLASDIASESGNLLCE